MYSFLLDINVINVKLHLEPAINKYATDLPIRVPSKPWSSAPGQYFPPKRTVPYRSTEFNVKIQLFFDKRQRSTMDDVTRVDVLESFHQIGVLIHSL
jgi:hypothetical protein